MPDTTVLPDNLPPPIDDGACKHLTGMPLPDIQLPATDGTWVTLKQQTRTVLYIYPKMAAANGSIPAEWNAIPGARGCTPQSCSFRDHFQELQALNTQVYGVSSQTTPYQQEAVGRLHLPFTLLSDSQHQLHTLLQLPMFSFRGEALYKRVTLIIEAGRIQHVFYPVFPPDTHIDNVINWLEQT